MSPKVKSLYICIIAVLLLGAFGITTNAAFNEQINYQGKLTDINNVAVANGDKCMKFRIMDALTLGNELWAEEWNATTTPVTTYSGLFSVMLGTHAGTTLSNVNFNQESLYLEVQYDPDSPCDENYQEIFSPRKRLGAVPAAFEAKKLGGKLESAFGTLSEAETVSGAWTFSSLLTVTAVPSGTGVSQGSLYINPASATADYTLLGIAVGGSQKFRLDADGDMAMAGNLTVSGTTITATNVTTFNCTDCIDFDDLEDTLDLDSNLILNQTAYTWTQNFTGTTTTGLTYNANSLTSGAAINIGSTGTGLTSGSLLYLTSATTGTVATAGIVSLNATGDYTSTSNVGLLNVVANATTAGTVAKFSGTELTTGQILKLAGGTGLTTGNALTITGGKYVHTGGETGSLVSIGVTDASTNTTGSAVTIGINISSTFNTSASVGSKNIIAINVSSPTLTACGTTDGSCAWTGFRVATAALTQTTTNTFNMKAFHVFTAGALVQNTEAGTIDWQGLNIQMPNITQTTGTVTSTGIQILGGIVTSGTSYGLIINAAAGNVGIGDTTPDTVLDVVGLTVGTGYTLVYATDGSGDIFYDASSKRYKKNIQPLEDDFSKILKAQPKTFTFKTTGRQDIGYIAEDFQALGLNNLILYNQEGLPEAIKYDRIPLYLLEILKKQQQQIEEIKLSLSPGGKIETGAGGAPSLSFFEQVKQVLVSLGLTIENGIAQVKELIAEKIFAKKIQTNELEMIDKSTGEIYCTWIENGEWKKVKGECGAGQSPTPQPQPPPAPEPPAPEPEPQSG